jgi:hypothetical protein
MTILYWNLKCYFCRNFGELSDFRTQLSLKINHQFIVQKFCLLYEGEVVTNTKSFLEEE